MKKSFKSAWVIGALAALPLTALAEGLSYNFVDIAYVSVDFDDIDVDADGFSLGASALLNEYVYLTASYGKLETDKFTVMGLRGSLEVTGFSAGLGYRHELSPGTDLNFDASFLRGEVEGNGDFSFIGSETDTGYGLAIGLRHLLTQQFEIGASVNYVDIFDDDGTSFTVGALFHVLPNVSLGASYSFDSDADAWAAGVRFNF